MDYKIDLTFRQFAEKYANKRNPKTMNPWTEDEVSAETSFPPLLVSGWFEIIRTENAAALSLFNRLATVDEMVARYNFLHPGQHPEIVFGGNVSYVEDKTPDFKPGAGRIGDLSPEDFEKLFVRIMSERYGWAVIK